MYVLRTWCTCIRITQSSSSSTQYVCVCEWVKWPLMTTLFSLFCPLLSSCYVLVHWSCACVCVCAKRERERDVAQAESSEGKVRGKQARTQERASERAKGTGHHKDEKNAKKMHYNQTDDYLTLYRWSSFERWLVMVTTFSFLLPSSHCISRSHALFLRSMQHLVCPATRCCLLFLPLPHFFLLVLPFFSL